MLLIVALVIIWNVMGDRRVSRCCKSAWGRRR
jgi:hypothetical protein